MMTTPQPHRPRGTSATTEAPLWAALVVPVLLGLMGALFVVGRLLVGAGVVDEDRVSERENRTLAPWPVFSWAAVEQGTYTRDIDAFVADHFPLREQMLDLAATMKDARGLDSDARVYDGDALGDFGLDATLLPIEPMEPADAGVTDVTDGTDAGVVVTPDGVGDGGVDLWPVMPPSSTPPRRYTSGIAIVGDRGLMYLVGGEDEARAFAAALNEWPKHLPDDVTLSVAITPTATHFFLPEDQQEKSLPQKEHLAVLHGALDPRWRVVDVEAALQEHRAAHPDEALFFRTDHHWTARGALVAHEAWARQLGLPPIDLTMWEQKVHRGVLGSLYRFTQSKALRAAADDVEYFVPPSDDTDTNTDAGYTASRWRVLNEPPKPARFIVEREKSYAVFLGGDDPLLVAKTSVGNGRKVLLVKNSYGNAMAPYLLANFEEVVVVDYRYFGDSLAALVKKRRITDVLVVNATVTTNSKPHARRLRDVITGRGTAWATVTAESQAKEIEKFQQEAGKLPP